MEATQTGRNQKRK